MYNVRKIFRVPIGHRLMKHAGLCKNIHGHNLKIEVQLHSSDLDENDMVIDFKDLKKSVTNILNKFDHCTIFNSHDKENIQFFKNQNYKSIVLDGMDPTAEILCRYLYLSIGDELSNTKSKNSFPPVIYIDFVRIWENDDSMAEYKE